MVPQQSQVVWGNPSLFEIANIRLTEESLSDASAWEPQSSEADFFKKPRRRCFDKLWDPPFREGRRPKNFKANTRRPSKKGGRSWKPTAKKRSPSPGPRKRPPVRRWSRVLRGLVGLAALCDHTRDGSCSLEMPKTSETPSKTSQRPKKNQLCWVTRLAFVDSRF